MMHLCKVVACIIFKNYIMLGILAIPTFKELAIASQGI
jgi:hypothetical protein